MSIKFTDSFFEFPIKVYDHKSLRRQEECEDPELYGDVDWVSGSVRLHVNEIQKGDLYYQDWFSDKSVEEVRDEGFDQTAVYVAAYGEFICTWSMKKFEKELNAFMAKQGKKEEDLEL